MLEGPFAILALCGPSIHLLVARVVKYKSLNSLFTSRTPLTDRSDYSASRSAAPRNLTSSRDGGSSTTAFANNDVGKEERFAANDIPMGAINMQRDIKVDHYP